jgi:pre-mRNA-splicing factor 38A
MANATDPLALSLHGTNPQNLLEKILRLRIYQSRYWKESCFGLTAATLIDRAVGLDHLGSTFGANSKPTPFICLLLKLLQIQPAQGIIMEYVQQEEYKYLRALGAFYLRLTARAPDVYASLEPLLADARKLVVRTPSGWLLTHMDELVDELLTGELCLGVALARLPKRDALVATGALPPRESALADLLEADGDEEEGEGGREGSGGRGAAGSAPPPPPLQQQRPRVADNRPQWLAEGSARPVQKRARSGSGGSDCGRGGGGGDGGDDLGGGGAEDGEVAGLAAEGVRPEPAPRKPVYRPLLLKGRNAFGDILK